MALVETSAAVTALQRAPSQRAIDRRWDRSRRIVFSDNRQNVLRDYRWSRSDRIVFADVPSWSRGYAGRSMFPWRNEEPAQQKGPPLMKDPHRVSGRNFQPKSVQDDEVIALKRKHDAQLKIKEENIRTLKLQVKNLEAKEIDFNRQKKQLESNFETTFQDKLKRERLQLQADLKNEWDQLSGEDARLKAKERQIESRESEVSRKASEVGTREAEVKASRQKVDSVFAQNLADAQRRAAQEVEGKMKSTDQSLKQAREHQAEAQRLQSEATKNWEQIDMIVQDRRRIYDEAVQSNAQKLVDHQREVEQTFEKERAEMQHEMEQPALQRGRDERADYASYREIWAGFQKSVWDLEARADSIWKPLFRRAEMWKQTGHVLRQEMPSSFRSKYPALNKSLDAYFDSGYQQILSTARSMSQLRTSLHSGQDSLMRAGHGARKLTRFHRFQRVPANHQTQDLLDRILNEEPLRKRRHELSSELSSIGQQLATNKDDSVRRDLQQKRQMLVSERLSLNAILQYYYTFRECRALEAAKEDEVYEKQILVKTQDLWKHLGDASVLMMGVRDLGLVESKTVSGETITQKNKMARRDLEEAESIIRRRWLLGMHLGKIKDLNEHLDAEIDNQIEEKKRALKKKAVVAFGKGRTVSRRERVASKSNVAVATRQLPPLSSEKGEQRNGELGPNELNKKLADKDTYTSEKHRQKNEQLQADLKRLAARRRMLERESPVDYAHIRAIEKEIETIWKRLRPGPAVDAIAKAVPNLAKKKARRRARSKRKSASIAASESTDAKNQPQTAGLNFKPTPAQRAPARFWSAEFKSFHGGSTAETSRGNEAPETSEPPTLQAHADANSGNAMPLSQAPAGSRSSSSSSSPSPDSSDYSEVGSENLSAEDSGETASLLSQPEQPPSHSSSSTSNMEFEDAQETLHQSPADESVELTYRIPQEDYRRAVLASKNTDAAFWGYKLYKNAEGKPPSVHYCISLEAGEAQAKQFLDEPIIGFDLEWEMYSVPGRGSIKNNVSLIQIASESKIALFHIALFKGETTEDLMPPSLRTILESRDTAKAGVNVSGDARRLSQCLGVNMVGLFELSHLYKIVSFSETAPTMVNRRLFKLADQVQNILLLPLKKDEVRTSTWSKRLRVDQSEYAASDAYAGFQLYHALEAKRKKMDPVPPRPAYFEEGKPLQLGNGQLVMPKKYTPKKKPDAVVEKEETQDDDEVEDFFDAVESQDSYNVGSSQTGGVPLSGLQVSYPTLPPLDPAEASKSAATHQTPTSDPARTTNPSKPKQAKRGPPLSTEVAQADQWVTAWRASLPAEYYLRAGNSSLRAYHLWHEQGFSCEEVAGLLRDPPLSLQTVAGYVVQAVTQENLPYRAARMHEPFEILPKNVRRRYKSMLYRIKFSGWA